MYRLALLVLYLMLAGCGKPAPSDQQTLTMWLVGSEAQAQTINSLADAFTKRTGVRVHCEAISWGEAHSKYLTAVAGGVQPDIGTMGLTWGVEFGRLGALVNLLEAYPQDVAAIQRETFPGLWQSIEENDNVFGIPLDLSLQTLYYRTDLIPHPPQTWEELTALLTRLRAENRRLVFDWGGLSWIGYAPFLWQAGGDFYAPDRQSSRLDRPEAVRALEFFRDLYTKHDVPKTSVPMEQGLRTGEFPIAISGNWKIVSLTIGVPEIAGKWAVGPLPKGPGGTRTAFLGGRIMTVFSSSKSRDVAWEFIKYLFEPKAQIKLYEGGLQTQDAYLPPNMTTWEQLPMEAAMKTALQEQAKDAKGPPPIVGWTESTHLLESAIQRVILHDADPKTELTRVAAEMTKASR